MILSNRTVYFEEHQTGVVSDLHIGRSIDRRDEGNRRKIPFPPVTVQTHLMDRFDALLSRFDDLERLVFAGDLLHKQGRDDSEAVYLINDLFQYLTNQGVNEIVWVRGNHDVSAEQAKQMGLSKTPVQEYSITDSIVVTHGKYPPEQSAELYVSGHHHAVKSIDETYNRCFLYGEYVYDGSSVVVIPPFSDFAGSTKLTRLAEKQKKVFDSIPVSSMEWISVSETNCRKLTL